MNEEQCWHSGRVHSDEIYCQAATPKLSTSNKNYSSPPCNKECHILYCPWSISAQKRTSAVRWVPPAGVFGRMRRGPGEKCTHHLF